MLPSLPRARACDPRAPLAPRPRRRCRRASRTCRRATAAGGPDAAAAANAAGGTDAAAAGRGTARGTGAAAAELGRDEGIGGTVLAVDDMARPGSQPRTSPVRVRPLQRPSRRSSRGGQILGRLRLIVRVGQLQQPLRMHPHRVPADPALHRRRLRRSDRAAPIAMPAAGPASSSNRDARAAAGTRRRASRAGLSMGGGREQAGPGPA
jgi:hypothetical protein